MPGLSNIFGGDDSQSSSDGDASGTLVGDASNMIGLDVDSEQMSHSRDEDGNESTNSNSNNIGLDSDTDGLLGAVGDAMGSSDETTD